MSYRFRITWYNKVLGYSIKPLMFLSMIFPLFALSQKTIRGKVYDAANNRTLTSAFIIPKGSYSGISTDNNGNFTMKIAETINTIVVSHVGYEIRSIKVNGDAADYSIGLNPLENELAQVTVIGSEIYQGLICKPLYRLM